MTGGTIRRITCWLPLLPRLSRLSPLPPLLALLILLAGGECARADTLGVAVAANLQYAFADLQAAFEKQTGHRLQPSFNSSGRLATQITLGAPFDLFLAADMGFPEKLQQAGAAATPPVVYAKGVLVLWSRKPIDLVHWQQTLAGAAVRRIALPNPETAPYGREALRTLEFHALRSLLQPKLVYAESVAQANQYVYSEAVEAGFTAKSAVVSGALHDIGTWIEIPPASYHPIEQGVVITRFGASTHPVAARQLRDFLLSAPARAILARNGYLPP